MAARPVHCWLIHNGFISFKRQIKGIAQQLDVVSEEIVIQPNRFLYFVPLSLQVIYYYFRFKKKVVGHYPLVVIGTGRLIIPVLLGIKLLNSKKTFAIFVQKPAFGKNFFDLIVAPEHDYLAGKNVLQSLGAINDFNPQQFEKLSSSAEALANKINTRPLIAIYLGGKTKKYSFRPDDAKALLAEIEKITHEAKGTFIIVSSRRTGAYMENLLKEKFNAESHVLVYTSDNSYNPYMDVLSLADYFFVTEDSVNLMSEACFTGKPVYLLKLPNYKDGNRKVKFVESMVESGLICYYQPPLTPNNYNPLREAQRLGPEIQQRVYHWLVEQNFKEK
ncbi:MAG TPA: mitochondrial fission ELM1 family protein [Coxiellaceae bacterium]|nr:mitochondrial fission ELM1 family protein [Coxiellaceae bacterium]